MDSAANLSELVKRTEELLARLDDSHGAEVNDLRRRLKKSVKQTQAELDKRPDAPKVKVRDVAASLNIYVRDYPWLALATGVLLASTVGILATTATRRAVNR